LIGFAVYFKEYTLNLIENIVDKLSKLKIFGNNDKNKYNNKDYEKVNNGLFTSRDDDDEDF
jgi:hypothetical protein